MRIAKKISLSSCFVAASLVTVTAYPAQASQLDIGTSKNDGNNAVQSKVFPNQPSGSNLDQVSNNASVLQAPSANSSSTGSFVNLGGTSIGFDQDAQYSSVSIGPARCPKPSLSAIGSYNGVFQKYSDVHGASGAVVFSVPMTGKDGKRCSQYLDLQVQDLYYSMGFKSMKACFPYIQEGITYFDPELYGERPAAICNTLASQYVKTREVQIIEKEVPVQVPIPPTHSPADGKLQG